jgi:hypothetical protein
MTHSDAGNAALAMPEKGIMTEWAKERLNEMVAAPLARLAMAALFVRTDDRSGPVIELKSKPA